MIYPFDYEKEVGGAQMGPKGKIYATPITARENDILTARHQDPAWVGQDLNHILIREIKDNPARGTVMDGMPYEGEFGGKDMFGVEWVYVKMVRGSMEKPGVHRVHDLENWENEVSMPNLDEIDWEAVRERVKKQITPAKITSTMLYTGFFERLISFVGFEDAALALIDEDLQDAVHRLFDKLCIYYDDLIDHLQKYCGLEYVLFHDDWGSQKSTFFSEATCREMLLPYLTRVIKSAHDRGILFNFHCCGRVEKFVPIMIEAGADAWDGQPMNDIWGLYKQYGDKLNFTLNEKVLEVNEEQASAWVDNIMCHLEKGKPFIIPNRQMNGIARELLYTRSREFYGKE